MSGAGDSQEDKAGALVYLLREIIPSPQGVLIFVATRHHAEFLVVGSPLCVHRSRSCRRIV